MSAALLYLPYFPNVSWLQNFVKHDVVQIEREENFVKSTFRNRCDIAGANGRQTLSIPLKGGRDRRRFYKDVKISYADNWQRKHWQAIRSAYGSAPYFEYYAEKIEPFYDKRVDFLFDFNFELLNAVLPLLKVAKTFELTQQFEPIPSAADDLRNSESSTEKGYYQVFAERNGFIPNLCVLDLLFNEGPRAREIISR